MFNLQEKPDPEFKYNDNTLKPVQTLVASFGGGMQTRIQIVVDDHCYLALIKHPGGAYQPMTHYNKMMVKAIKKLPPDPDKSLEPKG